MFSYNTPKWNIKVNTRALSLFFTIVYAISLIPMLVLAFYNFPSADDFSMALEPHQYFVETGSFLGTIGAAFVKAIVIYNTWVGYFFSSFLTCLSPSIFGEQFYFLVPFIILGCLTISVWFFFNSLLVKLWRLDKHLTNALSMLSLIVITQSIENGSTRAEAFYWYSGAVNYSFMFGLSLLWVGCLIRILVDKKNKSRIVKTVIVCILGFLLGGANYMSALGLAVISVIIIFLVIMIKKKLFSLSNNCSSEALKIIWIPSVFNILGIIVSSVAPGNFVRMGQAGGFGPIKAILTSIYYVFDLCINDMTRWEVLIAFVCVFIISWKLADSMSIRLEHPFLFALFSMLLIASAMTPPLYATGNIVAGRVHALVWMEYIIMSVLSIFYITTWIKQRTNHAVKENTDNSFSINSSFALCICIALLIVGSGLSVIPTPEYYCATSAVSDLLDGSAATYAKENAERLSVLSDDSVKSVGLNEYSVHPELLFYADVTQDKDEWLNQITAKYYGKDEVYQIPKN